jgi:hypothetical protein
VNSSSVASALENLITSNPLTIVATLSKVATRNRLYYKKTAYNWLNFCTEMPPCLDKQNRPIPHTQFDKLYFRDQASRDLAFLFLNGKLAFLFWFIVGDDFHLAHWMFDSFPVNLDAMSQQVRQQLSRSVDSLESAMREAVSFKQNAGKRVGNYNLARCRHVTDKSDAIFLEHLGLTDLAEEFELFYSAAVRTDFEIED